MRNSDSVVRKKVELQSRGVRIQPELFPELEVAYNAPAVRTGRMVFCFQSPRSQSEFISAFVVNGKRSLKSPLHLVKNCAGKFEIWWDEEKYSDISFVPRPKFYSLSTPGGAPTFKLAVIVGHGHLRSIIHQDCLYFQKGSACRFCAVQNWWDANLNKSLPDVADIVATGVKEGAVRHVSLTTATQGTPAEGLEDLVTTAKLIHAKCDIPMMFEFEPPQDSGLADDLLKEALKAGVTTISCNIECFDEKMRPQIMPAKGKLPISAYINIWERALKIFGVNQVHTVAIAGIGETDESLLNGIEMAASHGVITFLVPHSPAIGAELEDMLAPTADRMLFLYEKALNIYHRYGLDITAAKSGCVRGGGFSAITDVARFST